MNNVLTNDKEIFYDKPFFDKEITMSKIIPVNFKGKQIICKGTYSTVYLYKEINTDRLFSVKEMDKNFYEKYLNTSNLIYNEIEIHSRIIHPNIIRLYNTYENKSSIYLIMEYAKNGNLYNLFKRKNGLNEKEAQKYFFQISKSIYFLHKNDVIHRDIKPENILLDENNNCKLCDFGWSVILKERLTRNTFCGTLEYMAPEIINNENYEKSIDIWSLGVLLYEILHGFSPFYSEEKNGDQRINISNNIKYQNYEIKVNVSFECKDLIKKMLEKDFNKRIKINEVLNHPFLNNYINNNYNNVIINNLFCNNDFEKEKYIDYKKGKLSNNNINDISEKAKNFTKNILFDDDESKKINLIKPCFSDKNINHLKLNDLEKKSTPIKLNFIMMIPKNSKTNYFSSNKTVKMKNLDNNEDNNYCETDSIENVENDKKLDFSLFESLALLLN